MSLKIHVGGAESDSFITVTEAGSYLESLPDDTTGWEELATDAKELRLQLSAQLMGYLPFRGRTVFRYQRLCFPRTSQPYGRRFKIPVEVKRAQAYIAYSIVHRKLAERPEVGSEASSEWGRPSSISLGGLISVSFSGKGTGGSMLDSITQGLPFPAYALLKPYMSQIRGRAVPDEDELRTLSTTTTTEPPQATTTTTV
jgi:hypothetical protein